jgi:hypothetical protein
MSNPDSRQKLTDQCNDIAADMQETNNPGDAYFQDWNVLMQVVNKIEDSDYSVIIEGSCCTIYDSFGKVMANQLRDTKKWATFHAVHDFIKKTQVIPNSI